MVVQSYDGIKFLRWDLYTEIKMIDYSFIQQHNEFSHELEQTKKPDTKCTH